jgi:hypothetical protein
MAQEFTIKSQAIEDKINQLLPSQGGFQAGVDFSASTMVIPIVDLTESAEGSSLRQDLQTSLSLNSITTDEIVNQTTTVINTTGYFRCFGSSSFRSTGRVFFTLTDGTTSKIFLDHDNAQTITGNIKQFDFILKLEAGDSVTVRSTTANAICRFSSRQIADIQGNLVNP